MNGDVMKSARGSAPTGLRIKLLIEDLRRTSKRNPASAYQLEVLFESQSNSLHDISTCLADLSDQVLSSEQDARELVSAIDDLTGIGDELVAEWAL